jgi:hypothetical protein
MSECRNQLGRHLGFRHFAYEHHVGARNILLIRVPFYVFINVNGASKGLDRTSNQER